MLQGNWAEGSRHLRRDCHDEAIAGHVVNVVGQSGPGRTPNAVQRQSDRFAEVLLDPEPDGIKQMVSPERLQGGPQPLVLAFPYPAHPTARGGLWRDVQAQEEVEALALPRDRDDQLVLMEVASQGRPPGETKLQPSIRLRADGDPTDYLAGLLRQPPSERLAHAHE